MDNIEKTIQEKGVEETKQLVEMYFKNKPLALKAVYIFNVDLANTLLKTSWIRSNYNEASPKSTEIVPWNFLIRTLKFLGRNNFKENLVEEFSNYNYEDVYKLMRDLKQPRYLFAMKDALSLKSIKDMPHERLWENLVAPVESDVLKEVTENLDRSNKDFYI